MLDLWKTSTYYLFLLCLKDVLLGKHSNRSATMCAISQGFNESVVTSVATYILDSHASCTWLLSSANHHLTLSVDQVPNVFLYHYLKGIVVSNNNTLPILHVGSNFLNINDN